MGRLGNISGKEAAKAFGKAGWHVLGQVENRGQTDCYRFFWEQS